jgi:hypothetical protein
MNRQSIKFFAANLLIVITATLVYSHRVQAGWAYVPKSVICDKGRIDSSLNGFASQYDTGGDEDLAKYYEEVTHKRVLPYQKNLCEDPKVKYAEDIVLKALDICKNVCRESRKRASACEKLCEASKNEGIDALEVYSIAAYDFTGDSGAVSCPSSSAAIEASKLRKAFEPIKNYAPDTSRDNQARELK